MLQLYSKLYTHSSDVTTSLLNINFLSNTISLMTEKTGRGNYYEILRPMQVQWTTTSDKPPQATPYPAAVGDVIVRV